MAKVTLFKENGRYYTEEEWRVPENAISPHEMIRSEDFRRIGNGAVLVQSQEPWGYPCLFPTGMVREVVQPATLSAFTEMMIQEGVVNRSEVEPPAPSPQWTAAEWQHVLTGDRVRIGQQEAYVTTSSNSVPGAGDFHADSTDEWRPKKWDHKEVRVRLEHLGDAMLQFPPASPVEILMNRERQAIHLLQTEAGATVI